VKESNALDEFRIMATFPNGGLVMIHRLVSETDSDYTKLLSIANFFAQQGRTVVLTPKMKRPPQFNYARIYGSLIGTKYEDKCPDMMIDGVWYEHEEFTSANPKRAFRNMLAHGLKQSSRLIIDAPGLTYRYMKRVIYNRVNTNQDIDEILIRESTGLIIELYKKTNG